MSHQPRIAFSRRAAIVLLGLMPVLNARAEERFEWQRATPQEAGMDRGKLEEAQLEEYLSRRLEEFELAALMMDGLEVAGQTIVVTLDITIDGTKVPLGSGWARRRTLRCAPRCCRTFSSGGCTSMSRFSV